MQLMKLDRYCTISFEDESINSEYKIEKDMNGNGENVLKLIMLSFVSQIPVMIIQWMIFIKINCNHMLLIKELILLNNKEWAFVFAVYRFKAISFKTG